MSDWDCPLTRLLFVSTPSWNNSSINITWGDGTEPDSWMFFTIHHCQAWYTSFRKSVCSKFVIFGQGFSFCIKVRPFNIFVSVESLFLSGLFCHPHWSSSRPYMNYTSSVCIDHGKESISHHLSSVEVCLHDFWACNSMLESCSSVVYETIEFLIS